MPLQPCPEPFDKPVLFVEGLRQRSEAQPSEVEGRILGDGE